MIAPIRPPADEDWEAALDAAIALNGLEIDPAWRRDIIAIMKATGKIALPVLEFPLENEPDPAPVFRP